jgi:integrase
LIDIKYQEIWLCSALFRSSPIRQSIDLEACAHEFQAHTRTTRLPVASISHCKRGGPELFRSSTSARRLAVRTRSAHDQDLARCALYLANVSIAVGALAVSRRPGPSSPEDSYPGPRQLLGASVGLKQLSPHDLGHYWATAAIADGTDLLALQEAGGRASLAMPRRYVERAKLANERVKLQT